MDLQHRLSIIKEQPRAYIRGAVEYINEEWIFFDAETEEASLVEELTENEVEVFTLNRWEKGTFFEDGLIKMKDYFYKLENGDCLRVRKQLPLAYTELLQSFPEEMFVQFTITLNNLGFSLFDCIYCHNYLLYSIVNKDMEGVNFITYDNSEIVCNVLHHFSRGRKIDDRFEFTIANGKRAILSSIS